ncbi:MAG: ATP-binding protein [Bacteroidota bacterium]
MQKLIGREAEIAVLRGLLKTPESEFVALYGRRRVGKTFLINQVYKDVIKFEVTGLNKGGKNAQLENFMTRLNAKLLEIGESQMEADSWLRVFFCLQTYFEKLNWSGKAVIFIDELPWLATPKSGFLTGLENFWNSWASKRADIILVVCGSAASWMISKIVRSRGGLHNRITKRIRLLPFTLKESEAFLVSRNVQLDRYSILELYMAMGGIPHYLKEVERGKSVAQNIDAICFSKDGLLRDEFPNLYEALFYKADRYVNIVKVLAKKPSGLERAELLKKSNLSTGGTTTRILEALEESGFIQKRRLPGPKRNGVIFSLVDPYSAFYLKFIEPKKSTANGGWKMMSATPSWRSWAGFAFERICLAHIDSIKTSLGISGVYTESYAWRSETTQVDLVMDRADRVINLWEIKFSAGQYTIDKAYSVNLRNKIESYKDSLRPRKSVFLSMLTTFGIKENQYSNSLVEVSLTMDDLFN